MSAALLLLILSAPAQTPPHRIPWSSARPSFARRWIPGYTASGGRACGAILSNEGTPEDIRARIRGGPRGQSCATSCSSAPPIRGPRSIRWSAAARSRHLEPAVVNVHWGSEPLIASDNWYADLDDDGVPDVAIGRLTVRSVAELQTVVQKIVAYEKSKDFHRWRSRINFVAGTGGFGPLVDSVIQAGRAS